MNPRTNITFSFDFEGGSDQGEEGCIEHHGVVNAVQRHVHRHQSLRGGGGGLLGRGGLLVGARLLGGEGLLGRGGVGNALGKVLLGLGEGLLEWVG